jgi:hypothetical protein
VRESRTPGSVRGVLSNEHPYRDSVPLMNLSGNRQIADLHPVAASLWDENGDHSRQLLKQVSAAFGQGKSSVSPTRRLAWANLN